MNDQTAKRDEGKLMLSLVPMEPLEAVAAIRMYGNEKYHSPDNWKGVEKERYINAAMRHLIAYLREPYGLDSESNLPHLWHCLCNLDFLCALDIQDGTSPKPQDAVKKMRHPEHRKFYKKLREVGCMSCYYGDRGLDFTVCKECKEWSNWKPL